MKVCLNEYFCAACLVKKDDKESFEYVKTVYSRIKKFGMEQDLIDFIMLMGEDMDEIEKRKEAFKKLEIATRRIQ